MLILKYVLFLLQVVTDYAAQQLILLGRPNAVLISLHSHHAPPMRQLFSRAAGYRHSTYFTFQFGTPVCSVCEDQLNEANRQKERWREEAGRQKAILPDLFKDTERPSTTRVFLLNSNFMFAWRWLVQGLSAGKTDSVGEMCLDTALDKTTGSVPTKLKVLLSTEHTVPPHP